jgi:hypothetical protein
MDIFDNFYIFHGNTNTYNAKSVTSRYDDNASNKFERGDDKIVHTRQLPQVSTCPSLYAFSVAHSKAIMAGFLSPSRDDGVHVDFPLFDCFLNLAISC